MADEKEKAIEKDQETIKPVEKDVLTEKDVEPVAGGLGKIPSGYDLHINE